MEETVVSGDRGFRLGMEENASKMMPKQRTRIVGAGDAEIVHDVYLEV